MPADDITEEEKRLRLIRSLNEARDDLRRNGPCRLRGSARLATLASKTPERWSQRCVCGYCTAV